jgi:hypothetical protein
MARTALRPPRQLKPRSTLIGTHFRRFGGSAPPRDKVFRGSVVSLSEALLRRHG